MAIDPAEQHRDVAGPHPEGLFDAQMSLPLPFVGAPEPFTTVLKRDGREAPFERAKIANAIFRAAQSIGGDDEDLADSLARAVTIYLTKQLGSHVPTVDHIHDAVERVLISMAHIRTAFAYARYRDRRARIRRLREGDMRLLLGELEEAQRSGVPAPGRTQGLFVRTSDDTILSWNRDRIVEALVLETGLDAAMAGLVAAEVEQQLEAAEIKTLTTSLVRELVAARLVAHGLHEYRERHQRLGVPLYDCERIIRGLTNATTGGDPVKTDYVLAGAVKKEYALARVYSPHVSEAHLQGAIHLHGLEKVDRLRQALLSPGMIAQFGVGLPGAPDFASPPRNAITFLAQLAKATANFQAHFSGSLAWDAVNYYFAPYVAAYSPEELAQFAQMIVYEFAYRAMVHGGDGTGTELRLYWTVPDFLAEVPAVGLETKEGETPKCYRDFEHAAQQLAWKLLEVLQRSGGLPVAVPIVGIGIDERFFREPAGEAFLNQAATLIEGGYAVRFYFSRGATSRDSRAHWQPAWTLVDQVAINLPRLAYETGKESSFMEKLDHVVSIAGLALQERFSFLEGLLARGLSGPLGLLAVRYGIDPLFDFDRSLGFVSVDGLNEAVQTLLNAELHTSEETRALGERILERIQQKCKLESRKRGLSLGVTQETETSVGQRFAASDAISYPKTAKTAIKVDESIKAMHYSAGVSLSRQHGLSPFTLAQSEGELHAWLDGNTFSTVTLPSTNYSAASIVDLLKKLYFQTRSRGVELR
jgi:ribonucleoside-triphosphate reductase